MYKEMICKQIFTKERILEDVKEFLDKRNNTDSKEHCELCSVVLYDLFSLAEMLYEDEFIDELKPYKDEFENGCPMLLSIKEDLTKNEFCK